MYLDDLPLEAHSVGCGALGRNGALGWEGRSVSVNGRMFAHALSAHAPSSLMFALNGQYDLFTCGVALNDTAIGELADVTFQALADGVVVASVEYVRTRHIRHINACVRGAHRLELRVRSPAPQHCHSVWLDPQVDVWPQAGMLDCLGQVRIFRPPVPIVAEKCIVTLVSAGYARWLDIFLTSLRRNGNCPDAEIVVYRVGEDATCDAVIRRHGAHTIPCEALVPRSATIRPAVFSISSLARVRKVLVAEADMIVLEDISALWETLDVCEGPCLLAAREHHWDHPVRLDSFFGTIFQGTEEDLVAFGATEQERAFDLQINGGVIVGTGEAIAGLDSAMRDLLPFSREWVQRRPELWYRELFVINLAMAKLSNAVRLDPSYNVQLFNATVTVHQDAGLPRVDFRNAPVKILHFSDHKGDHAALQSYYWEHGNPDCKLAEGLARIRKAPLERLREPAFVAELIRQTGLQETQRLDAALLYGDDFACMNAGPGLFQIPMQLARALVYLSDKQIRTYAEVGIFHGWTFAFITAYLDRFTSLDRSVAIDTGEFFTASFHVCEYYPIELVVGTSAALAGQAFDLVFIDGDHAYVSACQDYFHLGQFGRFCMFHDINDSLLGQYVTGETVKRLWREQRAEHPGAFVEFLDHTRNASMMGIGLLSANVIAQAITLAHKQVSNVPFTTQESSQ